MSYNFLNYDGKLVPSDRCLHDSSIGYEADFSVNGEVDGWTYYDGIHTYGCWNNFLFGTLYGVSASIGRFESFAPLSAEDFYIVRVVMKFNLQERVGSQILPSTGRLMWRTISNPSWGTDKQIDFDLIHDDEWNTYNISMASSQWWQGDINDLRLFPILNNGKDGDEFYIRTIEIFSSNSYKCLNVDCSYYSSYEHNCPGIGERGTCTSAPLPAYVSEGVVFEFAEDKLYTIEEGVNDVLHVNINGYGLENVVFDPVQNYKGTKLANLLAKEISKLDVGGYAECDVEYTAMGEFIIHSGTYVDDSTAVIGDSQLARDLQFYDDSGNNISTLWPGRDPSSGFRSYSSFRVKTHQVYSLLDGSDKTEFYFNPFIYNVEGGRRDWLDTGLGDPTKDFRAGSEDSGVINRYYNQLDNAGKTIIDFTHPFNASGRVTKIYAGITLDTFDSGNWNERGSNDSNRKENQLSGAKIMFFRPLKNGSIKVLPFELTIEDRDHDSGKLYSATQEYIDIDCDIFVNKGDLIGVYNANIYRSRTVSGQEIDALYYQVAGKPTGVVSVRQPSGQGSAGLLLYARSDQIQNRLVLEMDLGQRVNVTKIDVVGGSKEDKLEYNIARCLDVNWEVDLFGEDHTTGYIRGYRPLIIAHYNHPNLYYGKNCLSDGIRTVPDGLAAESFQVQYGDWYYSWGGCVGKKDGGKGVVTTGSKYFYVNGDSEWLAVYLQAGRQSPFAYQDFEEDPLAFTMIFPYSKDKVVSKFIIYFKDRYNFRSFAVSTYKGESYTLGNADDPRFELIPNRTDGTDTPWTRVSLDGLDYTPEDESRWGYLDLYLANNPVIGHPITKITRVMEHDYDGDSAYFDALGGLQYYAAMQITNNAQYTQATAVDWSTLEMEWKPFRAKGFRFHCSNHRSTKICEFEVYCAVEHIKSSMGGSVDITYSTYEEYWWSTSNTETDNGITAFIGDTPQYINIVVKPITEVSLSDITLDVSYEDVFMGEKGCQHTFLPLEAKRGAENVPKIIDFKNVYGRPYDLYVNIAGDSAQDEGAVFFSLMDNKDSITNPVIGPDAYYRKHSDYLLLNYQKNVAINCPVYALKSLHEGAEVWYTHNDEYSWRYWGKLTDGKNINFSNLPNSSITTLGFPVLTRSKWWKIGFSDPRIVTKIREIQVYYQDEEIEGVKFYHHKNQDAIAGANTDTAPHLDNDIIDGSYYTLRGNYYIGIELPAVQKIDKILFYQDSLLEYQNSHNIAGIDSSTALCIRGVGDTLQTEPIEDVSYYEHAITVGNDIYCDNLSTEVDYGFVEEFRDCEPLVDTFPPPEPDPGLWTNLVNATIVNNKLHITNSGIIGTADTITYFEGDFDAYIDLSIDNAEDNQGWGGYIEAFTDTNKRVRVGRTYHYSSNHSFRSYYYDTGGWHNLGSQTTSDETGLRLRVRRVGETTTCYGRKTSGTWYTLGSTTALGALPARFRLMSDLTPLAQGITTAQFDNFSVDRENAYWSENTSNGSSFACVSGISTHTTDGWVYEYNIGNYETSYAGGYHVPKIFPRQSYPIDQDFAFTFDFMFKCDSFVDPYGVPNSNNETCVVGILGKHVRKQSRNDAWPYWTGVQVLLRRNSIGIGLTNEYASNDYSGGDVIDVYTSLNTRSHEYFCRFTSDGNGHYQCQVWTDDYAGANRVVNLTLNHSLPWEARYVGVAAGYNGNGGGGRPTIGRCTGWVADFDFYCHKVSENHVLNRSSIRFNATPGEKLLVDYNNSPICNIAKRGFDFETKRVTLDFWIKFNTLPLNNGDKVILIGSWHPDQPLVAGATISRPSSWAFVFERESSTYKWKLYVNVDNRCRIILDWTFYPSPLRWYHFYLNRGPSTTSIFNTVLYRDGHSFTVQSGYFCYSYLNCRHFSQHFWEWSGADVVVGENLDGWMEEIRVSSDYTYGGARCSDYNNYYYQWIRKSVPTKQYERYYTMTLYDSADNIFYGKNLESDIMFDNTKSYYEPDSLWCQKYNTYFAIDFGQRHDVELIRSYPVSSSFQVTLSNNVFYSNKDVSDPAEAFALTEEEQDVSTDFEGQDYDYPFNWTKLDTERADSYIIDNTFYQMADPVDSQQYSLAISKFFFIGDFDFHIDYNLGLSMPSNNSWQARLQVMNVDNSKYGVRFERAYVSGSHQYVFWVRDNSSSWTKVHTTFRSDASYTMRLKRASLTFKVYIKGIEEDFEDFVLLYSYLMDSGTFNPETHLKLYMVSEGTSYPKAEVWWNNFEATIATPMYSTARDARWVRARMLNGDGVTKTIENLGIYPNVSVQANVVGQYNTSWEELGPAITSYASADNIAMGATISGSSQVGWMVYENANNGEIPNGEFTKCWGSEDESHPWITIHFNQVEQIYRFKLYHGYDTSDSKNIIRDYRIQTSVDGETFTTVFDINNNTSFERTHDLTVPVSAKVVRFYVDEFYSIKRFVWTGNEDGYQFWEGAVLREMEIYKYYGYTVINSEDTPIIAVDLQQPFFIDGHSLVGIDAEDSSIDWSNSDSNYAWSNSNLSDPKKVNFGEWGGDSGYTKWVVLKRNTATGYPTTPGSQTPQTDMPDYLKHIVINASIDEAGNKPNPIEYPWMWRSTVSELSYDYDTITTGAAVNRTLRIDYPASTDVEHVRFIEGDHFGWDSVASWRDGFGLFIYIDDIDNFDLDYGYFYLGGYDDTPQKNPIQHRWNMSTLSGSLASGWNNINMTFLYADQTIYTELVDCNARDPRRLYTINWGTMGLVFRGKGNSLQINIDGTFIERNHFEHGCYPGQPGLYLHASDIMKVPVGELDFHSAALEFWIRPDWNWDGRDRYSDFKFRTLFHFGNVANDVFGAAVSSRGLEVYYGNLLNDFNMFIVDGLNFDAIEQIFHLAFVWSNNGAAIGSDNSTIRVYINNILAAKSSNTWDVSDDKHFNFILGGQGLLVQKIQGFDPTSSAVDAVICRLKIHNHCKTDFSDSMEDSDFNYVRNLIKPGNFIEISKDNVTYHKIGSEDLPFFFEDVPDGDSVPIWVKLRLPKNLTGEEKRTAKILGSWDIGV